MNAILTFPNFMTRLRIVRRRIRRKTLKSHRNTYLMQRESARTLIHQKLAEHNQHYNLKWEKVFIKNLKSRWGSCSRKGNLNFHYRIAFLPESLLDYVVVHEICHLQNFDHSKEFWDLVALRIPNHKECRKSLRMMVL